METAENGVDIQQVIDILTASSVFENLKIQETATRIEKLFQKTDDIHKLIDSLCEYTFSNNGVDDFFITDRYLYIIEADLAEIILQVHREIGRYYKERSKVIKNFIAARQTLIDEIKK